MRNWSIIFRSRVESVTYCDHEGTRIYQSVKNEIMEERIYETVLPLE